MWEFAASFRPHVVNHAVILIVKKRTRNTFQHIILVFINSKILINELLWLLPEMFGNSVNIRLGKKRPGGFAAVGTLQTIGSFELRIMQILHHIIEVFGLFLFELIKILFVFDMLIFG